MSKPTDSQVKTGSHRYLSTACSDHSRLRTKIGIISIDKKTYAPLTERCLIFYEYLQLIAQAFVISSSLYAKETQDQGQIFNTLLYLLKITNPGYFASFEEDNYFSLVIVLALMLLMIFKYLLFGYIVLIAFRNKRGNYFLVKLWRFIFKIQGRFLYFFVTSFWVNAIVAASDDIFKVANIKNTIIIVISVIMISLEGVFSLFLQLRFCYVLPTKSFLASKDNRTETMNLLQKILIQVLQVALSSSASTKAWIITCFNMVISLAKGYHYFTTLPYYNLKALIFEGNLLAVNIALNLACLLETIIRSINDDRNADLLLVIAIILPLLAIRISKNYAAKSILALMNKNKHQSPEFLIQKVSTIKQLRKLKRLPCNYNDNYEVNFFLNATINANIKHSLNISSEFSQEVILDINIKESANKLFLHYLESLLLKYPKNNLIKLYIAYIYAKKLRIYGGAMKILTDLQQFSASKAAFNASILIQDIQGIIRHEYEKNESYIDLSTFIKSKALITQVEEKMVAQADLQIKLCQEILEDSPDLKRVFDYSQVVYKQRKAIDKKMKIAFETVSEHYIEPILTFAYYHLTLNHSPIDFMKYRKMYIQKHKAYHKYFKNERLIRENVYQDDSVMAILSGQRHDAGKILFCSKSVEKMCGGEVRLYTGANFSSLVPPSFHNYYSTFFKAILENGEKSAFKKPIQAFGFHKEGYIFEMDLYLNIHPFLTQGFYFTSIMRPIITSKDCILMRENGDLEGITKRIGKRLGLIDPQNLSSVTNFNIKYISKELLRVNDAFNQVAFPNKYSPSKNIKTSFHQDQTEYAKAATDIEKSNTQSQQDIPNSKSSIGIDAKKITDLYSIYSTKGRDIKLTSLKQREDGSLNKYAYYCTVANVFYGSILLKVITLEESGAENERGVGSKNTIQEKYTENLEQDKEENLIEAFEKKGVDDEEAKEFELEDEKEDGWIDTNKLKTEKPETLFSQPLFSPISEHKQFIYNMQGENPTTTEGYNLSHPTLGRLQTIVARPLLKQQTMIVPRSEQKQLTKSTNTTKDNKIEGKNVVDRLEEPLRVGAEGSIASSKSSHRGKISKAFKAAVELKYTPKFFRILVLSFYILLLGMFVARLNLKSLLATNLENLQVKKNIVSNAETRTYMLIFTQGIAEIILVTALSSPALFQSPAGQSTVLAYANIIKTSLLNLAKTNQELLFSTNSLDEKIRQNLFVQDVRIFNLPLSDSNFINLTSFQATDRIVETGLKAVGIMQSNIFRASNEFSFLFRNCLNDVLMKNEATSEIFLQSIDLEKDTTNSAILQFVIITAALIAVILITFGAIIWKQYQREIIHMSAFSKLKTQSIKEVSDRLNYFKRTIENEKRFDDSGEDFLYTKKSVKGSFGKKNTKRDHLKSPNYGRLKIKYSIYFGHLLILVALLISLVAVNTLLSKGFTNFLYAKQDQIYFVDRAKAKINLSAGTVVDLILMNGTSLVRNQLAPVAILELIEDLIDIRSKAPIALMEEDQTYHPIIQAVLFDDGCQFRPATDSYCKWLKLKAEKTSFLTLLSSFESLVTQGAHQFLSDKSAASIGIISTVVLSPVTNYLQVLINECDLISSILNESFESEFVDVKHDSNLLFYVSVASLIVLGLLTWIILLRKLREANNEFKRVLQTLPATLVLSSFILKSFLIKTSKGALDFVRNEI